MMPNILKKIPESIHEVLNANVWCPSGWSKISGLSIDGDG